MTVRTPVRTIGLVMGLGMLLLTHRFPALAEQNEKAPLQIRVCPSLLMSASGHNALVFTRPMTNLLSLRLNYPVSLSVEDSHGVDDLHRFGEHLRQGTFHLGVVWGIEFAWLRTRFPDLAPLVIPSKPQDGWGCLLMVRRETAAQAADRGLAALKGSRLVRFQREPMMYPLSLEKILKTEGFDRKGFFHVVEKRYPTAKEAIMGVNRGEGDCLLLDTGQFVYLETTVPKLTKGLASFRRGPPMLPPAVIGRTENLERLRPRLWHDCQQAMLNMHETEEGRQCVRFWRIERFERPGETFDKGVAQAVRDFQLQSILPGPNSGED